MKAAAVGDNCMDVYEKLGKYYPGGNPVNFAVYMERMGVRASYIGVAGDDCYGDLMVKAIAAQNVDISRLHRAHGSTAITMVELIGNERVFGDYDEGVLRDFALDGEDMEFIKGHSMVHSAIWGRADRYFRDFKAWGLTTSFDFADKLDSELIAGTAPYVDYAFFSYENDDSFIRDYMRKIHGLGPKTVIATLGANGSLAFDGMDFYRADIVRAEVVDTIGAGDSYIAGFMYGVLHGESLEQCMKRGSAEAAETIGYFGPW